ncbi:hypothetical protein [Cypionkella sp. TWP1-2-1b2]|uniref:hypothetical protein n=1 Tax=Cypionkella sp. TWP1-2-1b2 TaxID=2804675 RepID=UPI003CF0A9F4
MSRFLRRFSKAGHLALILLDHIVKLGECVERKVVLELPISDEGLLPAFVQDCLDAKVDLISVYGPDAARIEDAIDWIVIGLTSDKSRWPVTASHSEPDWTRDEVIEYASGWNTPTPSGLTILRL